MNRRPPVKAAPTVLVFGGTADARVLCQHLDDAGLGYQLSVASDAGRQSAAGLQGRVLVGRLDADAIAASLARHGIRWVIDAAHPYAEALHANVAHACQRLGVRLTRYARASEIDALDHPLLHKVESTEQACALVQTLGPRVLLTTGSKDLASYRRALPDKRLLVRVLPTSEVLAQCEALGIPARDIIALHGPFTDELNRALYRYYQPDVVITKESGAEGGYQQKVAPCLALGISCVVVRRPSAPLAGEVIASVDEFARHLAATATL